MERLEALKTYFGYTGFRPGQEEIISALQSGQDVVAVMPTGAGKSLCFQLPALLMGGVTLVVSPLISLMKDQVAALVQAGIPAAFFNSSLTERQYTLALDRAREGRYQLIYIAPERLETERFLSFAMEADIKMVAVDEAHCVSQWGQDFRPHYLQIQSFLARLPRRPVVSAFTATATQMVREDICVQLRLSQPLQIVTGFDRANLWFGVRRGKEADKMRWLIELADKHRGESGVIYCATRKNVEMVCDRLCAHGVPATRYHAGLKQDERMGNQEDFLYDRSPVMVATNAFGMGIDKSNVRYVIHYNMPKDMESYYQEAGRAGRDGEVAECVLLYSPQDEATARYFIEKDRENEALDQNTLAEVRQRDYQRLKKMTRYCHTDQCLRAEILAYFGEGGKADCGNCGSCHQMGERIDITAQAAQILRCVDGTGQHFGINIIVDILRGSAAKKLTEWGLTRQKTYGALKSMSKAHVTACIRALVDQGHLMQGDGKFPILALDEGARQVLDEGFSVSMRCATPDEVDEYNAPTPYGEDDALLARLKRIRGALAREQNMPAYIVFSDATLRDMHIKRPRSPEEFLSVSGVGETKLQRYGAAFLDALQQEEQAHSAPAYEEDVAEDAP